MDHETGRLGDDYDIRILEPDIDGDITIGNRPSVGVERGLVENFEHAAFVQSVALRYDAAVDQYRACVDQLLNGRARPARQERDCPVDPIAVERRRDRERSVDHRAGAAGANSVRTMSTIAPTVMHESAKLKTGHHPTATKSTTWPRRKPGDRARRSARLPSAPPRTSTSPINVQRSVA